MSNGRPRKRDVVVEIFTTLKGFFQGLKKTKGKNSGSSQTNKTTANIVSAPVQASSDPLPTSSITEVATAVFASEAQIQGVNECERFQPDLASGVGQSNTAETAQHEEDSDVGNTEAPKHDLTATGISKFQSLWNEALSSKSLDEDRETLNSLKSHASALDTVTEAKSFVQKILDEKNRKAWKIKFNGEEIVLRDIAMKLLGWMERFKAIGDIIVQCDPMHAGLPWAGFRFLLEVCMVNQNTMDAIFVGLEHIAGVIHRCTLYELLYLREDSPAAKHLEASMIRLYVAILKFLAKAVGKLQQNRLAAIFTVQDISTYLDDIEKLEKAVGSDAAVANDQSTQTELAHVRAQLENINNTTLHIQPQLHDLQDWAEDSERSSILAWISNIPYKSHHDRINSRRLEGTGMWLLERDDYKAWISSSVSKLLLLRGTPGAGKTYIASKFIDSLHSDTKGMKLAYFYCNKAEDNRREPESILRTIIQQLAQSQAEKSKLVTPIVDIYQDRKREGQIASPLSLSESQELLVQLTNIHPRTMICVDALDEVTEDRRIHLLKALNYVIEKSRNLVKIFATTRHDPDIVKQFKMFPRIELQPDDNVSDINQFVNTEVQRVSDDGELLGGEVSADLKAEICQVLCERSKGMFQLAALQITSLCQEFTEGDVRRSLQTLPDTLTTAYNDVYHTIQNGKASRLALSAFRWIQCSYEPLRTSTLLDAITVEVGSAGEFSRRDAINAHSLLKLCQNLLVLDESLDVFRFAHLSVQEHLETKPELSRATSHAEIAKGCLSLLCTPSFWHDYEEIVIKEEDYKNRHLLSYSTLFWPWHFAHCADLNGRQPLLDLWNAFISKKNYQRSLQYHRKWVVTSYWTRDTFWRRVCYYQRGADSILALVCTFGLSRMLPSVFNSDRDLKDDLDSSLLVSCVLGHVDVASLLLDNGADSAAVDEYGRTLLHLASAKGHEEVVRLLIDRGANVSAVRENGETPLHRASYMGKEGVAQLLIDGGADISAIDKDGETPLHLASQRGHEEVVRLLIDRGANVSAVRKDGQTPLHLASAKGYEEMVRLLIDRGANVLAIDNYGNIPLHQASQSGYEEVVRLLIDRGSNVSAVGKEGWTPLHKASFWGRKGVAQLLIERGADISAIDEDGDTPLHLASAEGYEEVVRLLIDGGADVSAVRKDGQTPLGLASSRGRENLVRLLINRGANVAAAGKDGQINF